ncbi:cache domain-containing protein [Desulfococcaceae bacterium OttesenSCG-928-F15]|nr:cache domain-containing protein [Desulfococcaceae bacterium OttesenSCG-928-F15]
MKKNVLGVFVLLCCLVWAGSALAASSAKPAAFQKTDARIALLLEQAHNDLAAMAELDLVKNSLGKTAVYKRAKDVITLKYEQMSARDQKLYRIFNAIHESNPRYGFVYIGLKDGGFVQAPDQDSLKPGYDPSLRPWYREGMASPEAVNLSNPYVSTAGHTTISMNRKVQGKDGNVFGMVGIDIDLTGIVNEFLQLASSPKAILVVLDSSGETVLSSVRKDGTVLEFSEKDRLALSSFAKTSAGSARLALEGGQKNVDAYTSSALGWKILLVSP